jgi:hypothetical protein
LQWIASVCCCQAGDWSVGVILLRNDRMHDSFRVVSIFECKMLLVSCQHGCYACVLLPLIQPVKFTNVCITATGCFCVSSGDIWQLIWSSSFT